MRETIRIIDTEQVSSAVMCILFRKIWDCWDVFRDFKSDNLISGADEQFLGLFVNRLLCFGLCIFIFVEPLICNSDKFDHKFYAQEFLPIGFG